MEINKERVLAYQLATELKQEEIEKVSGGDGIPASFLTFDLSGHQSPDIVVGLDIIPDKISPFQVHLWRAWYNGKQRKINQTENLSVDI